MFRIGHNVSVVQRMQKSCTQLSLSSKFKSLSYSVTQKSELFSFLAIQLEWFYSRQSTTPPDPSTPSTPTPNLPPPSVI